MQNTPKPVKINDKSSPCLPANEIDDALELAKGRQDHLRAHGDEGFTDYIGGRRHSLLAFAGGRV